MNASPKTVTGIVTRVSNKGDSGRLAEIFCDDGIVKVYAAGARRLTSKFLPLTTLFSLVSLECIPNGDVMLLRDGKQLARYDNIEKDAIKFAIAADVIKNVSIATANTAEQNKFGALLHVFIKQLNDLGEYDECRSAVITLTVKTYVYVLAYCGIDVLACAGQQAGNSSLVGMLSWLSGKKVSEAMLDDTVFDDAEWAYRTLSDIYNEQLDLRPDKQIIL